MEHPTLALCRQRCCELLIVKEGAKLERRRSFQVFPMNISRIRLSPAELISTGFVLWTFAQ
jgi:hypothetical protein